MDHRVDNPGKINWPSEPGWEEGDPRFAKIRALARSANFDALVEFLFEMRALALNSLPALVLDNQDEARNTAIKIDLLDHIMGQLAEITGTNDEEEPGDGR